MLLHWLHQLPDLGILAVVVVTVTGLIMAAPHISRHVLRIPENKDNSAAAADAFKAVMSMLGIVLAFSLVQANNNLHGIETTVGKEASAISAIDRALLRIGKPELAAARPLLAAYGTSLIKDEWPRLAQGERSDATDAAYNALSKTVRSTGPDDSRQTAIYNELLRQLDDAADLREEVLTDSGVALPGFFWVTTIALLVLGLLLAGFADSSVSGTVGVGAPATAVALLLAFVIIVDRPFEGETSVDPGAIQRALVVDTHRI